MSNTYDVPSSLWDAWTDVARDVFTETYESVRDNYTLLMPPGIPASRVGGHAKRIVAWNVAISAANSAQAQVDQDALDG